MIDTGNDSCINPINIFEIHKPVAKNNVWSVLVEKQNGMQKEFLFRTQGEAQTFYKLVANFDMGTVN